MAEQHQAQEQHEQTAEELHELKRIRREKLAELQAAGNDPFQQVRFERDHYTSDIHEHFDELEQVLQDEHRPRPVQAQS